MILILPPLPLILTDSDSNNVMITMTSLSAFNESAAISIMSPVISSKQLDYDNAKFQVLAKKLSNMKSPNVRNDWRIALDLLLCYLHI